jgi:hypothetical protein
MSEKHPLLVEEEECFFLTSPFIEPDGHERAAVRLTSRSSTNQTYWNETFLILTFQNTFSKVGYIPASS